MLAWSTIGGTVAKGIVVSTSGDCTDGCVVVAGSFDDESLSIGENAVRSIVSGELPKRCVRP